MVAWLGLLVVAVFAGWLCGEGLAEQKRRSIRTTAQWNAAVQKWRADSRVLFARGGFVLGVALGATTWIDNHWVGRLMALLALCVFACCVVQFVSRPDRWVSWRPIVYVPEGLLRWEHMLESALAGFGPVCSDGDEEVIASVTKRLKDVREKIHAIWAQAVLDVFAEPKAVLAAQLELLQVAPEGHAQVRAEILMWEMRFCEVEWCADEVQTRVSDTRRWLAEGREAIAQIREMERRLTVQATFDQIEQERAAREEVEQIQVLGA